MKKIIRPFIILSLITFLISCSNYGKKTTIEGTKGEVYYTEGATENDAKKVGNYLKETGFLSADKPASIQVSKVGERYLIRFVYNKEYYEKNSGLENVFKMYGVKMSKELFNGSKVDVALADKYFKDFKSILYDETAVQKEGLSENEKVISNKDDYEKVSIEGTKAEVYYKGDGVGEPDAKKVGEFLKEKEFLSNDVAADILLKKDGEKYTIRFVYDKEYFYKTPGLEDIFKQYGIQMSKELFNDSKVDIVLVDKYFEDFKSIPHD